MRRLPIFTKSHHFLYKTNNTPFSLSFPRKPSPRWLHTMADPGGCGWMRSHPQATHLPQRMCSCHKRLHSPALGFAPIDTNSAPTDVIFWIRHWLHMSTASAAPATLRRRKIVVVMGPTGCGKTKLSIDLISRFFPSSEIINSDKIQVYRGLGITTNKIPLHERRNVRHHLLGEFDPSDSHPVFTPSDFRSAASSAISQILARRRIPFVVGGSNSLIYALLAKKFDPDSDVFSESDSVFCKELSYSCCFIWVDVSLPVLNQYLVKRVDDMLDSGMLEELAAYFADPESDSVSGCGLRKAIGVPELERYFKRFEGEGLWRSGGDDEVEKKVVYDEAVRAIKDNTCQLAKRQVGKILRLRDAAGWDLKRVDTTAALRAAVDGSGRRVAEIWERQVVEPSVKIVKQFLME